MEFACMHMLGIDWWVGGIVAYKAIHLALPDDISPIYKPLEIINM